MASLLLRLFTSDYFSPHLALSYLRTYADSIGITYYLVHRLSHFSKDDIDFYWPQLCHLLVTRPSESRALEGFILRRCEESVHTAFLTLWYFQAMLADLSADTYSPAFRISQRVYNRCQRILFEEPEPDVEPPRRSILRFIPFFETRRRVSPDNTFSAAVGIGAIGLATACPAVSEYGASVAIHQGRCCTNDFQSRKSDDTGITSPVQPSELPAPEPVPLPSKNQAPPPEPAHIAPASAPSTTERAVGDVFGQLEARANAPDCPQKAAAPHPSQLHQGQVPIHVNCDVRVASIADIRDHMRELDPSSYSYIVQRQYLRSHFGRTEMQFFQALQDIPARLQLLPKPARLSALRAELTSLNQTLPTEACFPTWCDCDSDLPEDCQRHHRVVRISASEAVVLNSADRVPYLLHIEVLRNDLDFDPNRRYNRELLSRILKHTDMQYVETDLHRRASVSGAEESSTLEPMIPPESEEEDDEDEIDLTEQMYGADLSEFGSLHPPPTEEGLGEKNVRLDTVAWAHAADSRPSHGDFSLEEYSKRMRTAAVMLAQLNKNSYALSTNITTHTPHAAPAAQGGWSSWVLGTPKSPANKEEAAGAPASSGARVIYADTGVIRRKIMHEMMVLEEERMERMKAGGQFLTRQKRPQLEAEDETVVLRAVNKDDPSAAYFKESWATKKERIRASSPYGHCPNWDLLSVIVKTGADLRQEQFAVQMINEFARVWRECGSRCWVYYFRIVVLNENAGLVETIRDAISIHSIKKDAYARQLADSSIASYSLFDHFVQTYGDPQSLRFRRARRNFAESLAGYGIVCYLLQIKDRHNGNILVDTEGHLVHIDFGFMLGLTPGGVGLEAAPFKLLRDYIDILGGMESEGFEEFRMLMRQGFREVRKQAERFIMLVELMQKNSKLPCFAASEGAAAALRDRFQLALTATQCDEFVDRLILNSAGSVFTRLYDQYQKFTQNIL